MDNFKKNSTLEQRRKQKQEADRTAQKSNTNIRCYGQTGFFVTEKQPDGTIKKKFYYGREGD